MERRGGGREDTRIAKCQEALGHGSCVDEKAFSVGVWGRCVHTHRANDRNETMISKRLPSVLTTIRSRLNMMGYLLL